MARSDPEKHRRQIAAANKARYDATKALIALYPDDFDRLYAIEAEKNGVDPKGPRPRKPKDETSPGTAIHEAAEAVDPEDPVERLRAAVEGFRAAVDDVDRRVDADTARRAASDAVADALGVEHDPFATVDALLAAEGMTLEPIEAVSPKPPF